MLPASSTRACGGIKAAQRLIQSKGYEQMSIQDVLDELDASRGAFYHYFDSKGALLTAVVDRMSDAVVESLAPVVTDPAVPALAKLEGMFARIARWKGERTELLVALLRTWMADDNAIVREKFRQGLVRRYVPLLASIIRQGRAEGTFDTGDPDAVARVVVSWLQGTNEAAAELFFARQAGAISFDDVERSVGAYVSALERTLGLPPGSVALVDRPTLHQWYG